MSTIHLPDFFWRLMKFGNRRVVRQFGAGFKGGDMVLLLTTTGRKSGLPRTTPLQYEDVDGVIYVASARGQKADWFCNLVAHPQVEVQIRAERFRALAEPITAPARIADFLEARLQRHPRMIRAMLLMHGIVGRPDRAGLERLAAELALAALRRAETAA